MSERPRLSSDNEPQPAWLVVSASRCLRLPAPPPSGGPTRQRRGVDGVPPAGAPVRLYGRCASAGSSTAPVCAPPPHGAPGAQHVASASSASAAGHGAGAAACPRARPGSLGPGPRSGNVDAPARSLVNAEPRRPRCRLPRRSVATAPLRSPRELPSRLRVSARASERAEEGARRAERH